MIFFIQFNSEHSTLDLNNLQRQSTQLESINFSFLDTRKVVLVNQILPFVIKYIQKLKLEDIYLKSISDLNSPAWATLDILLSAMYIRQYMSRNIQITINVSMTDEEFTDSHFDGSQKKMMRTLFPLTTSLGEGIWVKLEEE